MTDLIQIISSMSALDKEAGDELLKCFQTKTYRKGALLLRPEEVCKHFYFIETGLIKSFFFTADKEFIMTFFRENMMFTEISSYLTQRPSKYMLMALEETTVQYIHRDEIENLCKKHHCLETLFRKIFSFSAIGMMKRISEMLEEQAKERYNNFTLENPSILQRISLGDLASYLGITQVSLSRIRAGK